MIGKLHFDDNQKDTFLCVLVIWPICVNSGQSDTVFLLLFYGVQIILKIWALQDGTMVVVGGKTNRAKAEFPDEINRLLDCVPELVETSKQKSSDSMSG